MARTGHTAMWVLGMLVAAAAASNTTENEALMCKGMYGDTLGLTGQFLAGKVCHADVLNRILRTCPFPHEPLKCTYNDGMFVLNVAGEPKQCEATAGALANVGTRLTGAATSMADVKCVFGSLYFKEQSKCNTSTHVFNHLITTYMSGAFPGCQTTTTTPHVCDLMGNRNKVVDVTLISDSGSIFTLEGSFTRLQEGSVHNAAPNFGIDGTYVRLTGTNLLGGGTHLTSVKLAGLEVRELIAANDTEVRVRAAASPQAPLLGDVELTANTGAHIIAYDGFVYKVPGKIESISPASGMKGTKVTIKGTNLLGYGGKLESVNLVNTQVAEIVSQTDTEVVVVASPGGANCQFCHHTCATCTDTNNEAAGECLTCNASQRLIITNASTGEGACTSICQSGTFRGAGQATLNVSIAFTNLFSVIFKAAQKDIYAKVFAGLIATTFSTDAASVGSFVSTEDMSGVVGLIITTRIAVDGDAFEAVSVAAAVDKIVSSGELLAELRKADEKTYTHVTQAKSHVDSAVGTGDVCKPCDASCGDCMGPGDGDCLTCPKGEFRHNGQCLDVCPSDT